MLNTNADDTIALITMGNCFRTEQEAQEVATQRQFLTELLSLGDKSPVESGHQIWLNRRHNRTEYNYSYGWSIDRRYSKKEDGQAFIEKWGGEKAVAERLARGWK